MLLSRRKFILSASFSCSMLAAGGARADVTFNPDWVAYNLERAAWLSTNRSARRAVYVIAAPWCPYCEQLYRAQAQVQHDIDFRYVYLSERQFGPAVANAFYSDEQDQVGLFYGDRRARNPGLPDTSKQVLDDVNTVTTHLMDDALKSLAGGRWAFPTVIWRDEAGTIHATVGGWDDIPRLVAQNTLNATGTPPASRYRDYLRATPRLMSAGGQGYFSQVDAANLYAAPFLDAPIMDRVARNQGFRPPHGLVDYGGQRWVANKPFRNGDQMTFGLASDFFVQ